MPHILWCRRVEGMDSVSSAEESMSAKDMSTAEIGAQFSEELLCLSRRLQQISKDASERTKDTKCPTVDPPAETRSELEFTMEELSRLPDWLHPIVRKVWELCGSPKAPRKRTTRSLFEHLRSFHGRTEFVATASDLSARIALVARRYFKGIRALERALDTRLSAEYRSRLLQHASPMYRNNPRATLKNKIAPLLGSDDDCADDEVTLWVKTTLDRTGTMPAEPCASPSATADVEPIPNSIRSTTPVPEEGSASMSSSCAGKAARPRMLGSRYLHSMPSLQSVGATPLRNKPKDAAMKRSRSARKIAGRAELCLDSNDIGARLIAMRHDIDLGGSLVDSRIVCLRTELYRAMDHIREFSELVQCLSALEKRFAEDALFVGDVLIPARKNILRLLQIALATSLAFPDILDDVITS